MALALAASAPLCAGALLAPPVQAAPTAESDENGPLVQIIQPGYNDVLKGKYRILIQVTARKYNPQSVEMFIDDQSASNGPMPISSFASSSYDFPTSSYPDGRHKLTVRVTDSQGFRGWSETTVFINNKGVVDSQAPDLRWVGIDPFQEFSGSMKLEVNAADDFGVKMLQISINPADAPSKPAYSWMMNQPPYRINFDTIGKNIPDGLYVLKALAFDSLDQQGDAPPLTIGIVNNQINATRVQDMLDGQRQMQKVLRGEKLTESAPSAKSAATAPQTEAPVEVLPAATPVAPKEVAPNQVAPAVATPPVEVEDATEARNFVAATENLATTVEAPAMPATVEPAMGAQATDQQSAPALLPPTLTLPQQPFANPGIQLPRVNTSGTSLAEATAPSAVPQTEAASTEEDAPNVATPTEAASVAGETRVAQATPATEAAPATETAAPTQTVPAAPTRLAAAPSLPISQRNAGEASLSRSAAVELALTPSSGAAIEVARSSAPIEIARFSQPNLSGRAITDAPVLSQRTTNDESRLSNAELSRVRANKTRVLSAAQPIATRMDEPASTRALQTSAPIATQRPILSRVITADSVSTPAPKLTREAQTQAAQAAPAGSLSKAVPTGQRLAPLAVLPEEKVEVAKPAPARGAISKAAPSQERAQPIEIAPQMSAPNAPQMSESASGLGVPSQLSQTAEPLSGQKLNGERVAALPRPDAATGSRTGASIVAVPLEAPLEIGDANLLPVPTSYRAQRDTTLRAIAARFGLPVELVAIANNWATDMKVLSGMEVKLPRPLQVSYNGVPVTGDAPSMLMGDTAVTAFRFMFEKTGGKLEWDAKNQRVIARKDGREITLTIGSNVARVGERDVMMEIAAFLFQGRTMVPLRFFEEGLNAQVEWNPQTGRIVVAMAG